MQKLIVTGGKKLQGEVSVSGAKNVALKALIAACLTDEEVVIRNIPLISDFLTMLDIIRALGGEVHLDERTVKIKMSKFKTHSLPLESAARTRTSFMFIVPLLIRKHQAVIPNPGGCRLGARPVDRLVEGLNLMGGQISYHSEDGYFYSKNATLHGADYTFPKNTHMGTETLILAGVLAKGKTILRNAAQEPEIDELITLLNQMGGDIRRIFPRTIEINGVSKLHGTSFAIMPDRNEIVTFACAAIITKGNIHIRNINLESIKEFIEKLVQAGGEFKVEKSGITFYYNNPLKAVDIKTSPYPGFMTDWQAPWAVLMTQAKGESIVHETVFENKLQYIIELEKMGAKATLFNPKVENPDTIYNFNLSDNKSNYFHAVSIKGPVKLHNAVVSMLDIRAGAAVLLAALCAQGTSTIYDIERLDRGYEKLEERLVALGAVIKRNKE